MRKLRHPALILAALALCLSPSVGLHASGGDDAIDDIDFDEPDFDEPDIDVPDIDEPDIDVPDIDEPDIEEPQIDEPDIDEPDIDEPQIDEPDVDEPNIDEPDVDEPDVDEPEIDEPEVDEPKIDEPDVDEPDVDEPDVDKPDFDELDTEISGSDEVGEDHSGSDDATGDDDAADDLADDIGEDSSGGSSDDDHSGPDDSGSDDVGEDHSGSGGSGSDDRDEDSSGSDNSGSDDSGSDDSGSDNSGHGNSSSDDSDDSNSDESGSDDTETDDSNSEESKSEDSDPDDAGTDDSDSGNSGHGNSGSDDTDTDESDSDNSGSSNSGSSNPGSEDNSGEGGSGASTEAQQAEAWLADLTQSQDPEFDTEGNPVRRGELVALDLSSDAIEALLRSGFQKISVSEMPALEAELTILRVPEGQSANSALTLARTLDPAGVYDVGHYYASPFVPTAGRAVAAANPTPVRAVAGNLRVGLIDTAIRRSDLPRRISVDARAFGHVSTGGSGDHGTAVASILVANGAGELIVANVFDNDGRRDFSSAQTIGQALAWLMAEHVEVINVSLAGPRNAVLDSLVGRAVSHGTVIVAAAGNGGPAAAPAYPAALPDVVAVTAVDAGQHVYRYANRGAYVRVAAYGVRVPVNFSASAPAQFTGTSFAAPLVAARIARCIAAGSRHATCVSRMESSAVDLGEPGRDEIYGFGFVN